MKLEQRQWTPKSSWKPTKSKMGSKANLVLIFGETGALKDEDTFGQIQKMYPNAHLFGCSTSGEIHGVRVFDGTVSLTAISFEDTQVKMAKVTLAGAEDSFSAGKRLAQTLEKEDLTHVIVLSVGLNVNGSELVKGLSLGLPSGITMTGGLAGDQDRFKETLVIADARPAANIVAAIGLYGKNLRVGSASLGGWDAFGPERRVTRSKANVLSELDGKSALELYKTYLGEHARNLPGSALLFPLSLRTEGSDERVVRTILAVDEKEKTMTFAGDVPEGAQVRFMKANFDRLIEGAIGAAEKSWSSVESQPELALLISCVGRKIVLKQRIEEEVEGVQKIFGKKTALTGFYSYGEISPFTPSAKCELHNQTMTITTLSEIDEKKAA